MSPLDGTPPTKPWHKEGDGLSAPLEPSPSPHGTSEHKSCSSGSCTAPRWWGFSRPWRGRFLSRSQRATGGDALFLSVGSPSKREKGSVPSTAGRLSCVDRPWWGVISIGVMCLAPGQGLLFPERISPNALPHCFDGCVSPHTPRASWPNPVFNTPEFL